jgi:hypothetical protein
MWDSFLCKNARFDFFVCRRNIDVDVVVLLEDRHTIVIPAQRIQRTVCPSNHPQIHENTFDRIFYE